jgi:hypothetical protein
LQKGFSGSSFVSKLNQMSYEQSKENPENVGSNA